MESVIFNISNSFLEFYGFSLFVKTLWLKNLQLKFMEKSM